MRQILLDSTGLYNAELAMRKIAKKHEDTSGLHKFEYDALFNIVSAIVLWDEVVIFDEEFCSRSLKSLCVFCRKILPQIVNLFIQPFQIGIRGLCGITGI